jgi:hypothetical protein
MGDKPNAVDLINQSLDVVDRVIKMTCNGDAEVKIEEGGFAHCRPPGLEGIIEGGKTKSWTMLKAQNDDWAITYDWHMTASWEFGKQVDTADKGLWGSFIDNATVQVAMPTASMHLAWDWVIHFPGQGSWQNKEKGQVELPFLVDLKCYDTIIVKTFKFSQSFRGVLYGDGSAHIEET